MWQCHKCSKPVYFGEYLSLHGVLFIFCLNSQVSFHGWIHLPRITHMKYSLLKLQKKIASHGEFVSFSQINKNIWSKWLIKYWKRHIQTSVKRSFFSCKIACADMSMTPVLSKCCIYKICRIFLEKNQNYCLTIKKICWKNLNSFLNLFFYFSWKETVTRLWLASRVFTMWRMWETLKSRSTCRTQGDSILSCALLWCFIWATIVWSWHTSWIAQKLRCQGFHTKSSE